MVAKMTILLLLSLCLVTNSYRIDARLPIFRTGVSKTPVKSIQTKFGDIVDCVDINKQPAFDHPLLKNHKLQRKPTFLHTRTRTNELGLPINKTLEFELERVSCPIGSVPIRRTTKEDLIRMKSLSNHTILAQGAPGSHYAALHTKQGSNNYSYFGVHGNINVYNPRVKKGQMSLAQIAVQNGEFGQINTILFGWQVSPRLYGGRRSTHIFALWTSDSFKTTGCYNMLCPGFVQIHKNIFLGIRVSPTSSYDGPQFELAFSISKDPISKNWWLIVQDINIGYFPAEIFSKMFVADLVGWGGRVHGVVGDTSPQMGSGYFPDGDLTHACFIRQISYSNVPGSLVEPREDLLNIYVDNPYCYDLKYFGFLDEYNRYTFQFGGPGGDCGM